MRNGLRIGDLQDMHFFEARLRSLVSQLKASYPSLEVDIEQELLYYKSIRGQLLPNDLIAQGKSILIEGANATSKPTLINQLLSTTILESTS